MNTFKYCFVYFEIFAILISVIIGVGAAEIGSWTWANLLIFGPLVYCKFVGMSHHFHFCEVYDRAYRIKNINIKKN